MSALRTAGPGTKSIFGANAAYSSSYSPLKFFCITVVPCVFLFKPYRDVANNVLHGACKVKFSWVCLNTIGAGGQAWVAQISSALETLPYSVSTILTPHGWGRRKKFEIRALRWLENAILGLAFANTVFYKSTILLIFEAEVTEKTSSRIQSLL